MHLSWKLINLAVESESNDILSSCYYFLSKGGYFLLKRPVFYTVDTKKKWSIVECANALKKLYKSVYISCAPE